MLIEQMPSYKVLQSYASRTENEYEVYDFNNNRAGYIVENVANNTFEVYHSPDDITDTNNEDYSEIDLVDNYDEAIEMIIAEIDYDMN